jgi:hypothetical protein
MFKSVSIKINLNPNLLCRFLSCPNFVVLVCGKREFENAPEGGPTWQKKIEVTKL